MERSDGGVIRTLGMGFVNAYLIAGSKGHILVDAGMKGSDKKLVPLLKEAGVVPQDICLIIATHTHPDHVGGLAALAALSGAKLLCHRAAAELLADGKTAPVVPRTFLGKILVSLFPEVDMERVEADIVFDEEIDLAQFGVSGKAVWTPGHTLDSLSVFLDNGDALVGDLFRGAGKKLSFGFSWHDGTMCLESARRVLEAKPSVIFMSHGSTTDVGSIESFLARAAASGRVSGQLGRGDV